MQSLIIIQHGSVQVLSRRHSGVYFECLQSARRRQPPVRVPRTRRSLATALAARDRDSAAAACRRRFGRASAPQYSSAALSSRRRTSVRTSRSPPPSPHSTSPPVRRPAIGTQMGCSPTAAPSFLPRLRSSCVAVPPASSSAV